MPVPIVTFIGKSGAGKTTFLEKLVANLKWIALVADFPVDIEFPQYELNDVNGIANLLVKRFLPVSPGVI